MIRPFALLPLAAVLLAAPSAHGQLMQQLPAGVTLRITSSTGTISGDLTAQTADSVWLEPLRHSTVPQVAAIDRIQHVERSEPHYLKSMLIGGVIGGGVGTILFLRNVVRDRAILIGGGVASGAVIGLVRPIMRWVPVPLQ